MGIMEQKKKEMKEEFLALTPKPYLIAMKLKAGSLKDDFDVGLLTEEEKNKTHELAKLIHRDKKLARLIKPRKVKIEKEDRDLLI